jgi:putative DNA primase/helicase
MDTNINPISQSINTASQPTEHWPEAQPLTQSLKALAYPIDMLPPIIGGAVREVQAFVQSPPALVAASALTAVSLACQANIDIRRADGLEGPVSLALLTLAESGERKSSGDGYFMQCIKDFERSREAEDKEAKSNYDALNDAWEAEKGGIVSAIRDAGKVADSAAVEMEKDRLNKHHLTKPVRPYQTRLLLTDATQEALANHLHSKYPSCAISSAEAGAVFGGHGMGKDSIMRFLSTVNTLWDGNQLSIDRKTSESIVLDGVRLTLGLQAQPQTFAEFAKQGNGIARGIGFTARFLFSFPASTQGTRTFKHRPAKFPSLERFNERALEILNTPFTLDEGRRLQPQMMELSPEAFAAWTAYHNQVESSLGADGSLSNVRDVASKNADNAARLAALFEYFETGRTVVSLDMFERASRVAGWYLHESLRYATDAAIPQELHRAYMLDQWLLDKRCGSIPRNDILQSGPNVTRQPDALNHALEVLEQYGRVRLTKMGKQSVVEVNPSLLANK